MISAGKLIAYKAKRWQTLHGTLIRRAVIRSLLFGIAISMLPLMQFVYDIDPMNLRLPSNDASGECEDATDGNYLVPSLSFLRVLSPVTPKKSAHLSHAQCNGYVNLTTDVVKELVDKHLLKNYGAKALYVGEKSASAVSRLLELGFADVDGAYKHRSFFSLKQKQFAYELNYVDNRFDFVITRDLDKVSVPALLVNEVERVLKPGGLGAMLVGTDGSTSSSSSLIRSATPISSFLKSSNVIHVTSLNGFTLVTFKKRFDNVSPFEQYHLPTDCVSVRTNKPFLDRIEPLVNEKPPRGNIAYLPKFIDVSSKKQLVYIDMGARASEEFSVGNWFLPSYPIESKAFSVYIVDHDALVLSSHVNRPGVSFIYHPGLAGNMVPTSTSDVVTEDEDIPFEAEDFDFLEWFKETVELSDFVVMKMKLGKTEVKFLIELFESGLICSVDELFLQCLDSDGSDERGNLGENCLEIFRGLRSSGVFVHQWWGS